MVFAKEKFWKFLGGGKVGLLEVGGGRVRVVAFGGFLEENFFFSDCVGRGWFQPTFLKRIVSRFPISHSNLLPCRISFHFRLNDSCQLWIGNERVIQFLNPRKGYKDKVKTIKWQVNDSLQQVLGGNSCLRGFNRGNWV